MLVAVIMAGGRGERFWPKSRLNKPKQFLKIISANTMLQDTVKRLEPLIPIERVFVVTSQDYAAEVLAQLPEIPADNIILEPMGRDTAACIGLAATHIKQKIGNPVMVVVPSDQLICNNTDYLDVLSAAVNLVSREECIAIVGITPTTPETGYGYIRYTAECLEAGGLVAHKVAEFTEKPNKERAEAFIATGQYLWNSGMFIWQTAKILELIREHLPQLNLSLQVIGSAIGTADEQEVTSHEFQQLERISIDYGVMEKTSDIYVFPGNFGWDDVGSWNSLERNNPVAGNNPVEGNNVLNGACITRDSHGCIIDNNNSQKVIATIGVEDLVIVDTEDVLLVCHKDCTQDIKELLKKFREEKLDRYL